MISIEPKAKELMYQDAIEAYPDECCGFLLGTEDGSGNRSIEVILPVMNVSAEDKKRRFVISPRDYQKGEQFALDQDKQLLGVYHSHPDHPAVPSEHDRVSAQPWFSYIIISVSHTNIRNILSWKLNDQSAFEEEHLDNNQLFNINTQ